jgi:glycosyltransferase involved in cell wall biosynthesis
VTGAAPRRPGAAQRPVLFVTGWVPPDRAPALAALAERVPLVVATFGGRVHHATAGTGRAAVTQRGVHALAASGRFAAVVAGTAGRAALPAAWLGARRAGVPFVLWSALWAPLRTPAHVAAEPLLRAIHRDAACVVGYGTHVVAHARRLGARRTAVAPQAVDGAFWGAPADPPAGRDGTILFVGRDVPEKGLAVLRAAAARAGLAGRLRAVTGGAGPEELRNLYRSADVLVVPSLPTRRFREPWGLVANEAMHARTPVIATDAVGAAAGGLVRHGRNGLVVPAGDAGALAAALARLDGDPDLRERLGAAAARDVAPFTHDAWAAAFAAVLTATLDDRRKDP